MKITDIIFRFCFNLSSRIDGLCRVRTFIGSKGEIFVLLTDLGDKNPSASVTNAIEIICGSIIESGLVPNQATFIEHYESPISPSFTVVSFDNPRLPKWKTISFDKVIKLLECDELELSQLTASNNRLVKEIDKYRYQIDPRIDFPYRENPEVIKRRLEIESNSISKDIIQKIIKAGSKEQDISRLLKKDLSLFGEVYANPDEEYICFSEFPLANGYVDFAVFTGRSRMDIYLIEVKGANFNLVNQGNYYKFSSKVEEAAGQLRDRLGHIYRDYEGFRRKVHEIRESAESGINIYNSLIGPQGNLEVDPDKDISIYPVLIAGRSVNDLEESRKRQDYEYNTKPTLKIETWDTWLRKLRR